MTRIHPYAVLITASFAVLGLLCAALASPLAAQEIEKSAAPTVPGEEKTGEAPGPSATRLGRYLVGDPAPDIQMRDEDGKDYRLSQERKKGPVLIGFAPTPEDALEMERAGAVLKGSGISAVIIAPFHRDKLADVAGAPKVRFLHDRTSRIAKLYGAFDAVTSSARPGAVVVDERQRIRLIVSGIMPSGEELARSSKEAIEQARAGKVAKE